MKVLKTLKTWQIAVLVVLIAGIAGGAYGIYTAVASPKTTTTSTNVRYVQVSYSNISNTVSASGNLAFSNEDSLSFNNSGPGPFHTGSVHEISNIHHFFNFLHFGFMFLHTELNDTFDQFKGCACPHFLDRKVKKTGHQNNDFASVRWQEMDLAIILLCSLDDHAKVFKRSSFFYSCFLCLFAY